MQQPKVAHMPLNSPTEEQEEKYMQQPLKSRTCLSPDGVKGEVYAATKDRAHAPPWLDRGRGREVYAATKVVHMPLNSLIAPSRRSVLVVLKKVW